MSMERWKLAMIEVAATCRRHDLSLPEVLALTAAMMTATIGVGVSEATIRLVFEKAMQEAKEQCAEQVAP